MSKDQVTRNFKNVKLKNGEVWEYEGWKNDVHYRPYPWHGTNFYPPAYKFFLHSGEKQRQKKIKITLPKIKGA